MALAFYLEQKPPTITVHGAMSMAAVLPGDIVIRMRTEMVPPRGWCKCLITLFSVFFFFFRI